MKTILGHNLTMLRKQNKMTQPQLARMVGTSKSYIWELENKNPHPSVYLASKIAATLGVTTDELIDKPLREATS